MKQMKYSFLLIVSLCIGLLTRAQEFKVAVGDMKDAKLVLDDFTGDLQVEGYAGNEIVVTSNHHFEPDERAKGLKPIYAGGTDNTGLALYMEKSGNRITLRCLLSITQSGADYKLRVPENMAIDIARECAKDHGTAISGMKNEVDFKGCQEVRLSKVTGPLVVSTISGGVNVVFTDIAKDKPISISAISGEVDVTMPGKTAFSLEMSTVSGNMYSDFEFPAPANGMNRVGGGKIRADLNGGGTAVRLHNVSGNIYLRKG
jgi:lia operon protein LiaG